MKNLQSLLELVTFLLCKQNCLMINSRINFLQLLILHLKVEIITLLKFQQMKQHFGVRKEKEHMVTLEHY